MLDLTGFKLTGCSPRHSVSQGPTSSGSAFVLPDSKALEIVTHAYNLSSWPCLSFYQVSAFMHGVTQLGLGSQTVESSVHETVTTFQLYGSDQRACSTAQVPLPTPSSSGPVPVVTLVGHSPPGQT